jgi:hypothetical protein
MRRGGAPTDEMERGQDAKRCGCPVTGPEWPRWFQEAKVPRFLDNGTGWW